MPLKKFKSIDLRLLSYFYKSAELGNISKAAESLHLAQPTLSKAIRLLEHQLGAKLFHRNAHGVAVTEIGERLRLHAEAVMAQVGYAMEEVEGLRTGHLGQIRVGAGPSWVRQVLPEAIATVLHDRPELEIEVHGGFDEQLLQLLFDGMVDFIVAEKPLEAGGSRLEFERLSRGDLVVCARKEHPLAKKKNISIKETLNESWALPPSHSLARQKLDGRLISLGLPPTSATVVSSSQTFIFSFIRSKNVLSYNARSKLEHPDSSGIVEIDVPDLVTSRDAGIITRKPRLLTTAAEFLVDELKRKCIVSPGL